MKTRLVTWAGLLLSAALIGYLLYRFDFGAALAAVALADKSWLLIASVVYVSLFALRGYRWTVLLEPLKRVPIKETTEVFMIGVMANNVLPARLGDVARAFFLAKKEKIPASATFSNVLLERIFDGLAVVGLLNFVLWYAPPKDLWVHTVGWVMAAVFVGAVVFCTVIAFWEAQFLALAHRVAARLPAKATALVHLFEKLAKGLHTLKSPRRTVQVAILSLLIWMLEAAVYALVQRAFGLEIPYLGMVLVMSILTLGLTAPSAPGFVGVFEGLIIASVALYGVKEPLAPAFAITLHAIHYLPGTVIGAFLAWRSGLKIRELQAAASAPVADDSEVEPSVRVL